MSLRVSPVILLMLELYIVAETLLRFVSDQMALLWKAILRTLAALGGRGWRGGCSWRAVRTTVPSMPL